MNACEIARLRVRVFASVMGCVDVCDNVALSWARCPGSGAYQNLAGATIAAIRARVGFFLALLELNAASLLGAETTGFVY